MLTVLAYIFPQVEHLRYEPLATRFAQAYINHPPGETDHELLVVANGGGKITPRQEALFEPLAPKYTYWNNTGRDIGAYQHVARTVPCDFMLCLGAPVRPVCAGWLDMIVCALENHGPGIYAPWGFDQPTVHLRTTCFAITPQLLQAYPLEVDDGHRYFFEHGPNSITKFCMAKGFAALQVTRAGVFAPNRWHFVEPEESLFYDQFSDAAGWKDPI